MTTVRRLEDAIDKLEQLRAATDPARPDSKWVIDYQVGETMRFITVLDSHNGGYDGSIVAADITSEARAQLIVTLHRTIDAQLAILNDALRRAQKVMQPDGGLPVGFYSGFFALVVQLADAILDTATE